MSVLNSDILYIIFHTLSIPPPIIYKRRLGGLQDIKFYRAMLETGPKPPLPVNGLLFPCSLVRRAWQIPAQQIIRQHPKIRTTEQCRHFISVLETNPEAGLAIQALDFLSPISDKKVKKKTRLPSLDDIILLISKCPNLRTLRVGSSAIQETNFLESSDVTFPKFTALDPGWGRTISKPRLRCLLQRMPRLETLAIANVLGELTEDDIEHTMVNISTRLKAFVGYSHINSFIMKQYSWLLASSKDFLFLISLRIASSIRPDYLENFLQKSHPLLENISLADNFTNTLVHHLIPSCPNVRYLLIRFYPWSWTPRPLTPGQFPNQ